MTVAFDGSVVRPPYSGVQLSVVAELQALAAALGDLRGCVFFCGAPEVADSVRARGGAMGPLPRVAQRVAARVFWQQLVLPAWLRRNRIEALHALAYTAPLRCPVPTVVNIHDVIALESPHLCAPANRLHMRLLLPGTIRRAAALIVSTRHVAERVQARFGIPWERLTVAPLGVDAARFSAPAPRPEVAGLPAERPYWLFVGNIEPKKDVGTLLDAYAASAAAQRTDLVVVGRAGWLCQGIVDRLGSWTGPGRVHWLGRVPAADLPGLLQHALALVMPSIEEGFGMPVLEAMAAGTPVIHSDHPALREAAGDAGIGFPRGDAAALSACLDRLAEAASLRHDLAAKGRQHAAGMTWDRWGCTALDVVRQVVSQQ